MSPLGSVPSTSHKASTRTAAMASQPHIVRRTWRQPGACSACAGLGDTALFSRYAVLAALGRLGRPGQLSGELTILTPTSLKPSSSAGWKFSHRDVPKLLGFDLEYFLHTLYCARFI